MKRPYTQRTDGTIVDRVWQKRQDRLRANANLIHRLGLAHRWDQESARKAALAMWKKRRKGRSGRRLGFPAKLTPRIDHQTMRDYYSTIRDGKFEVGTVYYQPERKTWVVVHVVDETYHAQDISERAALTRLGHLKPRKR